MSIPTRTRTPSELTGGATEVAAGCNRRGRLACTLRSAPLMLDDLGLLFSRAHVLRCHVGEETHGLEEVQQASSPLLPLVRKEGRHETTTAHRVCVRTRPSTSADGV